MIVVVQTEKFARSMLHRNVIKNTKPRPIHLVFVGGTADEDAPAVSSLLCNESVFMPTASRVDQSVAANGSSLCKSL
jgi:hypothetical protein